MNQINFTFIIPHKNIPSLLSRCLDSIPRRDDIQIIIVDDNSDPSIVHFDEFPGVGEKGVEVYFTQEGTGAGYARNIGLKHAVGKWLLFADADDFYHSSLLTVLDSHLNSSSDIIFFNADSVDSSTMLPHGRMEYLYSLTNTYQNSRNDKMAEIIFKTNHHVPVAKMIKRTLQSVHQIYFEEIPAGNDLMFGIKCNLTAESISISDETIYCATFRPDSLRFKKFDKIIVKSRFSAINRANLFLKEKRIRYILSPMNTIVENISGFSNKEIVSFVFEILHTYSPLRAGKFILQLCNAYMKKDK
ncbi:MAG: glycosyltransferase [Bacteroidales bacterium]